jgi:hypothetical protein
MEIAESVLLTRENKVSDIRYPFVCEADASENNQAANSMEQNAT